MLHQVRSRAVEREHWLLHHSAMLTPALSRAARGLVRWSQVDLAKAASLHPQTVRKFENEEHVPHINNVAALRRALEAAGVEFTEDGGVRLKT